LEEEILGMNANIVKVNLILKKLRGEINKMAKRQIKEPDFENGDTLFNMFDYFCSRIDFGKSALDNSAIVCMNTLFQELRKQTEKIKV